MHIEMQNFFSFWGTWSPRPPTGASPLDPTGDFCPQTPCTGRPHILYQVYAPVWNDDMHVCVWDRIKTEQCERSGGATCVAE